jgi:hypothetical protein
MFFDHFVPIVRATSVLLALSLTANAQPAPTTMPPSVLGGGAAAIEGFFVRHPGMAIGGASAIGKEIVDHPLASAAIGALVIGGVAIYKSGKPYRKRAPEGRCITVSGREIPSGSFAFIRFDEASNSTLHHPHEGDHYHYQQATIMPNQKCVWQGNFTTDAPIPGALPSPEPFIT